ncbi:Retinaldehyde-binding protein 1-like Protein [Tribolium castaneum]|uniref:Retinaldehyde-binding protein 1-like Protein n=1 Tax=Tribolium castaneum TaxID=7070 RepID=A0A139WKD4_TRICA|nr:Retinaldehyde-binding protein 1-like Protein [Tribolium castaneum]
MSGTHLIMPNPWSDKNTALVEKQLVYKDQEEFANQLMKIAGNELREDEKTRKQCLEQLREWIRKNQDIENCRTDDRFLLRFLRVKKYSIHMAEQTLLKYLNFRKRFKEFMYGLDHLKSPLISNGYIFVSPFRDANGRRVIIYNVSKVDPHQFTGTDVGLAHAITYETLLADEDNQIAGVNHVCDADGLSAAFLTLWSITEFATIIRWGEQSLPMRHKEINLLNFPSALKYVYDFVHSTIKSEKLKNRIMIHGSLTDLHNKVDKKCLPLELGGVMPAKEMAELWKKELAAKRELLLSYDAMNLLSDRGIICRRNLPNEDNTGFHGSLTELHNKVDKRCLPLELGGVMPAKEMAELWKKELAAKRELLLSYDAMNLLSDRGIICRRNLPNEDNTGVGSLPGSFRKLEVD